LLSAHPGVAVEDIVAATSFPLDIGKTIESRLPTDEELRLLREVLDPKSLRDREVPA
jgi:hypothetical protein